MTDPHEPFIPGPDTTGLFRRALGRFGSGVTVVTALSDVGPLGFTANSFSSVSLTPPLVLWSLGQASRRHDAFAGAERYCIHILGAEQQEMALHFAAQGQGFDAYDWTQDAHGVPLLQGCLAHLHCTRHAVHPAGDHSIVVGEVLKVEMRDGAGLAFDQGRYGRFDTGA